jgi:hypothetical protein
LNWPGKTENWRTLSGLVQRYVLSGLERQPRLQRAGDGNLRLELDDRERKTVGKSLVERKTRLIESVGDTTQPLAARRSGLAEIKAIASVLRKLRAANVIASQPEPTPRLSRRT